MLSPVGSTAASKAAFLGKAAHCVMHVALSAKSSFAATQYFTADVQ
jgi:hypothetical protein